MPKEFNLVVDRFQSSVYLSAIRTKRDVIVIWMKVIKDFLTNQPAPQGLQTATLTIFVGSMSRVFCELIDGAKIFSLAFPFSVREADGYLNFSSRGGIEIDSRVSSQILTLVEDEFSGILGASDFGAFIDPIIDAVDIDPSLWMLIRELMVAEDVYVRYDHDLERANGHLHPLHHLDLGYSNGGTFKLGLEEAVTRVSLTDILNVEIDCHYLRAAPPLSTAQRPTGRAG